MCTVLFKSSEEEAYPDPNSENVAAAFAQAASSVWGEERQALPHLPVGDDNTVWGAESNRQMNDT